MSTERPFVTIVILTWNGVDYTRACLESLRQHTALGDQAQVIVVDNGSTDGTLPYLRQLEWITLIENGKNLGFVRGNNVGMRAAQAHSDILLLNNDTVITQANWLARMQEVAYSAADIGVVSCRMVLADGRLLHAGAYMPQDTFWGQQIGSLQKDVNQYGLVRDVPAVSGACFYIKRDLINQIGYLNEAFLTYFEDTDYCFQAAAAGYRVVCVGDVTITHHENVSTNINKISFSKLFLTSQKTFRKLWENKLMSRYKTAVFWQSAVGGPSGYAISAREMLVRLDQMDIDVRLAYLYGTDWMDTQNDDHRIADMRRRPKDLSLPQVLYASGDLFHKNSGRYRIGYTMLEVDGIPEDWILQANALDEVWVPSTFNKQTFLDSGLQVPIYVMPLGVNPDFYNPQIKPFRPSDRYTFLSVFEWGERKAGEVLLEAYHKAFSKNDDVLLIAKVINTDGSINVRQQINALNLPSDGPPVAMLYNQELPVHQMGSLYRSADCFVSATRGEGWGMPMIEAMACGLPVIATDWSAHTDFINSDVAYPLQVEKMIPAVAKCPYYEGFRWAQPDVDHLVHLMRHVYENREEAAVKGQKSSAWVLGNWTWQHAARKIADRLLEIGV